MNNNRRKKERKKIERTLGEEKREKIYVNHRTKYENKEETILKEGKT